MNQRPPTLRVHVSGVFFCRWGGKDHYFSKDRAESERAYLLSIQEWTDWRARRNTLRLPPMSKSLAVVELAELFLDFKESEGGPQVRRYYAGALRRFLNAYGQARADMIRASHVHAIKEDMLRGDYKAKTVNHDIVAIKSFLNWASGLDYIPAVNLRVVKQVPLGPVPDRSMSRADVLKILTQRKGVTNKKTPRLGDGRPITENLRAWLTVNYLTLARPIEVCRLVCGKGAWVEDGVFRLDTGKSDKRTRLARHLVVSPLAQKYLDKCEPLWSRVDSYYHACARSYGHGVAHRLRHSGATHLHQLGVARADIDLLLGHAPPRVSLTYARIEWQPLREKAALLTLKPVVAVGSSRRSKKKTG